MMVFRSAQISSASLRPAVIRSVIFVLKFYFTWATLHGGYSHDSSPISCGGPTKRNDSGAYTGSSHTCLESFCICFSFLTDCSRLVDCSCLVRTILNQPIPNHVQPIA